MKVLIINGSHRNGNTDLIAKSVKKELDRRNIETRELKLREIEMKLPDGCEVSAESGICPHVKDQFSEEIEPTIRDYDVYILATPMWSDGVTPLTKIFWDRIVSWCADDRMYLKGKKLALIAHGMAGEHSWHFAVEWIQGVCTWEKVTFGGSLTLTSGSKIGNVKIDEEEVKNFVAGLL